MRMRNLVEIDVHCPSNRTVAKLNLWKDVPRIGIQVKAQPWVLVRFFGIVA